MLDFRSLIATTDPKTELPVQVLWNTLGMMVVVLVAAGIIVLIGRWAKRARSGFGSAGDDLTSFRLLYERGEFSQEEYDRIRARLGQKLRQELNVPTPGTKEPPAPPRDGNVSAPTDTAIRQGDSTDPDGTDTAIKPA